MPLDNNPTAAGLSVNRRTFLRGGLMGAAGLAFSGLAGRAVAQAAELPYSNDYGPLQFVNDETTGLPLIRLPEGFTYKTFGWTGDAMADGTPTPGAHDGMAVVGATGNRVVLVRNHEISGGTPFAPVVYDPMAGGGTTNLMFDTFRGEWIGSQSSISGTVRNCAGGPTPWGSWLTCEETTVGPETEPGVKTHGWVFEVSGFGPATGIPIEELGRFSHEAAAVDPVTGIVYETEDAGTSGFYRFLPETYGRLQDGGRLQMLAVTGQPNLDLAVGYANDTTWDVEWVDIADPRRAHEEGTTNGNGVYAQGRDQGGARIIRGEGCWYDSGRVYFVSTSGGAAGLGQVFEYDPSTETLRLVYESPGASVLNSPDNIAVSPRGGIILCEDGSRPKQWLLGLTREGEIFPFAENNVVLSGEKNGINGDFTGREWCGATFAGRWLFVNIQTPGITFAITGPWDTGAL